jgi:REP element-mobilizing transposase RayT
MSDGVRTEDLRPLGEGHYGRKTDQPTPQELRAFRRDAQRRLSHPLVWFDQAARELIGRAFGTVIAEQRLTCYACAVMRNHAHLVIRKHRLKAEDMMLRLREASRRLLSERRIVPAYHPVWSSDPYVAFKDTPQAVRAAIHYIRRNFVRHGIPPQSWDFVTPYANWPFHRRSES